MKKIIICAVLGMTLGIGSNITANAAGIFSNCEETVTMGTDKGETFTVDYGVDQVAEYTENQFEEEEVIISCEPQKYTFFGNKDTFKYKLHIPDDGYLEYVRDDENENDQAILIYDEDHFLVGYIENVIPNNEDISVELSLKDDVVTQRYTYSKKKNQDSADVEVGINIVATQAEKFSTYFTEGKWITRSGQVSLSLYRRIMLETVAQRNAAWSTVNFRFNSSANWKNTTGMKDQFMCHSYFAKSKNPWNLEPWRPNVGYAQTVAKGCNP